MNLKDQLDALLDATAFDSTGTKVGAVRQVYVDDASGKLTFATVSTGIFSADAIVPLHGARLLDDELHVDHTRSEIRDSPRPDRTEDGLTPDQEVRLLEYYGIEPPTPDRDETVDEDRPGAGRSGPVKSAAAPTAGADTDSDSGTDAESDPEADAETDSDGESESESPEKGSTPDTTQRSASTTES